MACRGRWVASVEAWRAALAEEEPSLRAPFEVCGHSLGAYVAASYAAAHPARVARLVLAAPVGIHDMAERSVIAPSSSLLSTG